MASPGNRAALCQLVRHTFVPSHCQVDYRLSSSFEPYPRHTAPILLICGTCGLLTGSPVIGRDLVDAVVPAG